MSNNIISSITEKIKFIIFSAALLTGLTIALAPAQAATLFLAPSMGSYSAGSSFDVTVKVNTSGEAINTAEAGLTFDPTKLEVKSVSKSGSIFSLWVSEPSFSNADGSVALAGGKPSPGFTGSSGGLIVVTFKGLTAGIANVNFSSGSVLADDGVGTNILSSLISGVYTITAKTITTTPPPGPAPSAPAAIPGGAPRAPVITSLTHPQENEWYPNNSPQFSWQLPAGTAAVRLLLDSSPSSAPTVGYEPPISEKKIDNLSDGAFYLHVRFKNSYGWGAVSHRKVLIDIQPPAPFKITVDNRGDPTDPSPIFRFEAADELSGIEHYQLVTEYEDGTSVTDTLTPSGIKDKPYQPLPLSPGKYKITVKAADRAGNISLSSADFEVSPVGVVEITKIPAEVRMGDPLEIEGRAPAGLFVRIYIQKSAEQPILEKTEADFEGRFKMVYDKALTKGEYLVWAQAEGKKDSLSYPTQKYPVRVDLPPFLRFGKIAIDYLNIMVTLIVLVVGVIAIMFYAWYRISLWRRRVRKETGEIAQSVAKAFKALHEEVEEQIEFLDGKPGLTKDERKVRNKLKEALDISEEFIGKEIKDIEKELE